MNEVTYISPPNRRRSCNNYFVGNSFSHTCNVSKYVRVTRIIPLRIYGPSKKFPWGGHIPHFWGNHAPYLPTFMNENYFQTCLRIYYNIPFIFSRHEHRNHISSSHSARRLLNSFWRLY